MATTTIYQREHVASAPKAEVLAALRQFARAYHPFKGTALPGMVLN